MDRPVKNLEATPSAGAFQVELIECALGGFRDLVVALAERYPHTEAPLTKVVDDGLRHLRDGLLILQRHRRVRRTGGLRQEPGP